MTLTAETFGWVADLVYRRSAIRLEPGKEYLVESRLQPLARTAGAADVDSYVRALRADPTAATVDGVVEALTTNETSWFRDIQPFRSLADHVVPELGAAAQARGLRVWSAACSSGQEPYSIAMALPVLAGTGRLRVLGTDLNRRVLARAQAGRYSQLEVNRGLPATMLVRHFSRVGTDWEIAPALRSLVTFAHHNLLDAPPPGGPFDVVFLRNVLIYFDLATKRDVLRRVRQAVRPGGFLFLGGSETTIGIDDGWERVSLGAGCGYRPVARRAA